jgi:hypothetical protein
MDALLNWKTIKWVSIGIVCVWVYYHQAQAIHFGSILLGTILAIIAPFVSNLFALALVCLVFWLFWTKVFFPKKKKKD